MQAVDEQTLPRQCIMSIPHRLPTQSNHIGKKNTHAGCNLCCLRLGLINSPVSFAVMRLRCKLVHDAEKYVRHCRHAHNINELKHLIKKLRSWQSQYLRYVAGNHRKCGNALNKVWHVVDDVQQKESGRVTSSVCCGLNDWSPGAWVADADAAGNLHLIRNDTTLQQL